MQAIEKTKADISIHVRNVFPLIGHWYARRNGSAHQLAEPLFGLNSFAWGGEHLELDSFVIPRALLGIPFIITKTDSGYRLEDENGVTLAEGVEGRAIDFTLKEGSGRIAVTSIQARPGTSFEVARIAPFQAYSNVLAKMSVGEVGKLSNIIRVTYEDPSVEHANELVNAIAKAYLMQNVERRSAEADQSLVFLDEQLPRIKRSVEDAEEQLNAFRTHTNTVSVERSTETLLTQAVEVEKGRLQLELERDSLAQRYTSTHPAVRSINEQLEATRRAAEKVNEEVNALPAAQRDLLRLQRDADVSTQLYTALLNSAQQLRIAKAGTVGNVRVIDYALPNTSPVAPKKLLVIFVSGFVGLMLGVLIAFMLRVLRPTIRVADEIERATGSTVYATIPESTAQQKLDSNKRNTAARGAPVEGKIQVLATLFPDDPSIEALRSLRTGLAFALTDARDKNIVITGPTAALGKSFISANLGALLADTRKKVLLIETDLRRPQLGRYFGYSKVEGLSSVLAGTATFSEVVRRSAIKGLALDVLPAGIIPPNPSELLLGDRFRQLLNDVQGEYDHIVLDSAPVLLVADTLTVAQLASTVFLVARAEQSTVRELRDAEQRLNSVGVRVKGTILNGVKRRRVTSGYAYNYYYGYGAN